MQRNGTTYFRRKLRINTEDIFPARRFESALQRDLSQSKRHGNRKSSVFRRGAANLTPVYATYIVIQNLTNKICARTRILGGKVIKNGKQILKPSCSLINLAEGILFFALIRSVLFVKRLSNVAMVPRVNYYEDRIYITDLFSRQT